MTRWDPAQRRLAKQVLGRSARILLAGWIWERRGAAFFQSEATSALGDLGETPSAVIAELQKLVAYGALIRSDPGDAPGRVYSAKRREELGALEASGGSREPCGVDRRGAAVLKGRRPPGED